MNGATARIILRYVVGLVIGFEAGDALAGDADVVLIVASLVGFATEAVYRVAKRKGWAT